WMPTVIFNRPSQQARIIRRQAPVHEKITVGIHGNHALEAILAAQNYFSTRQIHNRFREVELELLRGKQDAHVPDAFVSEGFGRRRNTERKLIDAKIREGKIILRIHWNLN